MHDSRNNLLMQLIGLFLYSGVSWVVVWRVPWHGGCLGISSLTAESRQPYLCRLCFISSSTTGSLLSCVMRLRALRFLRVDLADAFVR